MTGKDKMLDLTLRQEFRGINMPGTDIALHKDNAQGATDISTADFLRITYPTSDVIKAIKTVKADRAGGPVVLMGGKGKGKSHLMAVMHHAIVNPAIVEQWLNDWSEKLNDPSNDFFYESRQINIIYMKRKCLKKHCFVLKYGYSTDSSCRFCPSW